MPNAAELIFEHFKGTSAEIDKIYKFVITDTPYLFKKNILKFLERKTHSQILSVTNRKTNAQSYPDGCVVTFSK